MVSRFVSGGGNAALGIILALSATAASARARDCEIFEAEIYAAVMRYHQGERQSALVAVAPSLEHRIALSALSRLMRFYTPPRQERSARDFAARSTRLFCVP